MNIVEPYARILDLPDRNAGIALLRKIEFAARVSHASEDAQTEDSWERFLTSVVLNHADWSVCEHEKVSVDALIDRGISHEWVRHRIGAYTQSSTRFINYTKKMEPSFIRPEGLNEEASDLWETSMKVSEEYYRQLISLGYPPQIARSVFPNALSTRLIVTYNLRNWRHFFLLRTTKETHPQMRHVTIPLLEEFKAKIPLLYEDIQPLTTQRENLKLPR